MSANLLASSLLNSLPRQLWRLIGLTLLMVRSFCSSFTSGTITLLFHAEGKVDVRMQVLNNATMMSRTASLRWKAAFHTPEETPSSPGAETRGVSRDTSHSSSTLVS